MSKKSLSNLLTEVELEIMNILWSIKEGSVRDVLARLPQERTLAYTSASTMLRILEKKKIVSSRKDIKSHIYFPILQKQDYEESTLSHVVTNIFDGTPSNLVKRLVNTSSLSDADREEIKKILAEL
ncbi:MAG: BlaI/MecI/CopY family transcriptional regulator [Bdellovibrionales bacterium]|nr:BlaI/MecI/CopY family transcriptional regulator [Bdellovibrionales bacterium]